MAHSVETRIAAARGFVRSLNILLKFARMYDFGHPRTAKQYETAWTELRTALGTDDNSGLLLAVSGDRLLLDGTPLDGAAAEKSFARMLSAAGIASIHFAAKVPQSSLAKFVRGFPTGNSTKATHLAEQLKTALRGDPFIHVNEVCFVPADSAVAKTTVAAQLAARTLGMNSAETDELFKDPEKLLQLIVAAEGIKGGGGGPGPGGPGGGSGSGPDWKRGLGGGEPSRTIEGPASGVSGAPSNGGGWNIVGSGAGSGTPVDPNAGGFWLNKSGSASTAPGGQASGSLSGTATGVEGGGRGWNIVGEGGNGGAPIDPSTAGFWLNKPGADAPPAAGGSASGALSGPAAGVGAGNAGWTMVGGQGGGTPVDPNAGGFWLNKPEGSVATQGPSGSSSGVSPAGADPGGSRWASASMGIRGARAARGGPGAMAVETGLMTLQEEELQGILQVLSQIARTTDLSKEKIDPSSFQSRLSTLPRRARFTVSQALSALAAQAPTESSDKPTLLKLAEHIAVRFALESYERGDVKVNAVRQMLGEMSSELDGLRKILGVYEERTAEAGLELQPHVELLAQEFWAQVPEDRRREVLEGPEAWCVPGAKVREYVEALLKQGDKDGAERILRNFVFCIKDEVADYRRQAASTLAEVAPAYAELDEKLLIESIRIVGLQLAQEQDLDLQSLVGAAFVRLSQEATKKRSFPAVQRAVELIDYVEEERPGAGRALRPRVGVENKLPDFVEDAVKAGEVPTGLTDVLRRIPEAAADTIAARFSRVGFREDCELLLSMIEALGPEGLDYLRKQLEHGEGHRALDTVGILARLDSETLEQILPGRMRDWKRTAHDQLVRQIAASAAADRGRLLLGMLDRLDPVIRPLAVDEIGMSGDPAAGTRLLRLAEGDLPADSTAFLQLKAIEALGRLRVASAEGVLRKIAESRKAWRWTHPTELRIVATQAMERINPDWVRGFLAKSGLSMAELSIEPVEADPTSSATRQRKYPRLSLERPVQAMTLNLKENFRVEVPEMALGGGIAVSEQNLYPGSVVELRLNPDKKSIRLQAIIRDANTQARAFEAVEIELEERLKLRKLLVQLGNAQRRSKPQDRNRRGPRTILSSQT